MLWALLTTCIVAAIRTTTAASTAGPTGCVTFDVTWNLLAFGFNGKDYNAGTQDTWTASGPLTDITAQGRPPFNSPTTTCYLSQFTNAIYVLNADTANPSSIYIYDATAKSWSTQQVTTGSFDPSNFAAVLDHDTNVFYAFSNTDIFSLDMALLKSATSAAIPWQDVQKPDLGTTQSYSPVIALAQNHVHFLGVPGLPAGSAKIFVIHFSFMQVEPQSYGSAFPNTHGKTASFFLDEGVQQEFAFIPDDGSATYVINVETNTTKTLTGPPQQDPFATYSASPNALVQLSPSGQVAYLAYDPNTTRSGGTWSTVSKIPTASFGSGSSPTGTGSNPQSSETGTAGGSGSGSGSGGTQASGGGRVAGGLGLVFGMAAGVVLGAVGLML
ncbi:hypothetical protein B0H34DRAFT_783901 [Crassisporium funariophilum]|nr:hypothetical protein B0H34DRAFT_783901 [Crassisporium funariophilum]